MFVAEYGSPGTVDILLKAGADHSMKGRWPSPIGWKEMTALDVVEINLEKYSLPDSQAAARSAKTVEDRFGCVIGYRHGCRRLAVVPCSTGVRHFLTKRDFRGCVEAGVG